MIPDNSLTPLRLFAAPVPTTVPGANDAVKISASALSSSVSQSLTQQRQSQLQALAVKVEAQNTRVLLDVLVKTQQPVDQSLRQLLQQLSQQQSHPAVYQQTTAQQLTAQPPATQALLATTAETFTTLLQSRQLFLLQLQVNGRTQWALSQTPVNNDKALSIAVVNERLWQVLDRQTQALPINILRQSLRDNLPKALDTASTFKNLQQMLAQNNTPRPLKMAVRDLLANAPQPQQLTQPKALKQVIKQSGVLWESRLHQISQPAITSETKLPATSPHVLHLAGMSSSYNRTTPLTQTTSALDKVLRQLFSGRLNSQVVPTKNGAAQPPIKLSPNSSSPSSSAAPSPGGDLKAQLLLIKQLVQTFLPTEAAKSGANPPQTSSPANLVKSSVTNQPNVNQQPAAESQVQQQSIQRIQQQVIAALAKIQLQQSQSLLQQTQAAQEGKPAVNVLQLEIPVHLQGDFHNLRLQLEQDWVERENTDNSQDKKKVRRWRVNLCIELPEAGCFYACVSHVNQETEVQLWAEQQQTAARMRDQLEILRQRLHQQGITVKSLRCELGTPTTSQLTNQVACALVDIRT